MAKTTKVKVNRTSRGIRGPGAGFTSNKVKPEVKIPQPAETAVVQDNLTVFGGCSPTPPASYPRVINSSWELEDVLRDFLGNRQKNSNCPEHLSHIMNARQLFNSALKSLRFADACAQTTL